MAEQIKNFGTTVLNGAIDGSTTTVVVLDGSVFPATGNFRIVVDSEIMLCTSRTGNTLTVTRGAESSTAASHLDAAPIAHILTAGSLLTYIQEQSIQSVVAGRGVSVDITSPKNPIVNMAGIIPASSGGTGQDFTSGSGIPNYTNGVASLLRYNLSATGAPTISSDNTEGYSVGSKWIDVSSDNVWENVDATTGAAVWRRLDGVTSVTAGSGIHIDNTDSRSPVIHSIVSAGWAGGILPQVSGGTGSNLFSAGSGAITSNGNGTSSIGYLPKWNFTATARPGINDSHSDGYIRGSIISITNPVDLTESGVYLCTKDTDGSALWKRIDNLNSNSDALANELNILPGFDQDNGYTYGSIHTTWGGNAYICVTPSTSSSAWKRITSDVNAINVKPSGGIVFTQLNQSSGTWTLGFRSTQTVPVANDPYDLLHGSFVAIGTLDYNRVRGINAFSVLGGATSASGSSSIDVMSASNDHEVLRRKANVLGFGKINGSGIEDNSLGVGKLEFYPARSVAGNSTGSVAAPGYVTASQQYTYLGYGEAGTVVFTPIVGSGITQGSVNPDRLQSQAAGTLIGRDGGSAGFPGILTPQSGVIVDSSNIRLGVPGICGHRLTLTSNVPFLASGVTSSTVYFTPTGREFSGMVSTYDGTKWVTKSYPQTSVSLASTASGTNFDFFFYDNNGAGLLEKVNWTNDTTRATALSYQDGVPVKSGVVSGLYVGMGRAGATDTCELRYFSDVLPARCFLQNYYNKVNTKFQKLESNGSWTYNSATVRPMNNNYRNRVEFVYGDNQSQLYTYTSAWFSTSAAVVGRVPIAINRTNASDAQFNAGSSNINITPIKSYAYVNPSGGFNFIQAVEFVSGASTGTFYGGSEGGLCVEFPC